MGLRLFLYGTLMRGERNAAEVRRARFIAPAQTARAFSLWDLGEYPALVRGGATAVLGELYEVEDADFAALDAFEGHPTLFRRESIRLGDGTEALAYVWPGPLPAGAQRLAGGAWRRRVRA